METRTIAALDPRLESLLEHVDWARKLAGRLVADAARADDVVQAALAAAVKSPPRDDANLRGWLGQVVRNVARGTGRDESRRALRERAASRPEAQSATDELVARAETTRDLAEHVLALDPIYREVVLLRWYENLPPREIAKELGVPVATVNTRLARAHGELRTRLDRGYGDRATWCAAFAPFAVMPKPALPLGAVAALSLLVVAIVVGGAAWIGGSGSRTPMQADSSGHAVRFGEDGVARRVERPNGTVGAPLETARADSAGRAPAAAVAASSTAASLPTLRVEGRAVGFDGRGIAGLALRGRDAGLPRIEKGWLWVGDRGTTIAEHEPWEWKNVPEALEHTLRHYGNPPGLREVLLGIDLGATTTTGADGAFAFDVPGRRAHLELLDEGRVLVAAGESAEIAGTVLLVAPAVRVSGTIVDKAGVPVVGARLNMPGAHAAMSRLPLAFQITSASAVGEIRSDDAGRFDLGSVATFPGARLTAAVETQYVADVELPSVDTRDLVLVATIRPVPAKPRVRGVVLDERGVGIAGAQVRIAGNAVNTDENGRFDLEEDSVRPDSELVAIKTGYAPGWVAGLAPRLLAERLVEDVEIRLAGPPRSITGRAVDADGEPLEGWRVSLAGAVVYPSMGIPVELAAAGRYGRDSGPRTDDDGRFEVDGLAPQRYRVRLIDTRTGLVFDSAEIEAGARDVEIRLPADAWRDEVRGRVVSTLGAPVANVRIAVLYPIVEGHGFSESGHAQETSSDSDGEFELEDVPRRGLKVSVSGASVKGAQIVVPDDADPRAVVLTVTIERSFRLETAPEERIEEFEVLDARGARLQMAAQTTTSIRGDFRVELDAGRWPVCAVSEEGATLVLYRAGAEVRRVPITWTGERVQVLRP